ncbi:uncharacterized protein AB675_3679 [Cyphellophora attinorum]|uniref:BTB domain-containing protein n=1 Tax=Cyphellophora attinorum TaxID=1664694 RepID=A0A0N1H0A5_9EURO|nr:uncharacterized protein AB675_3679 [Phialophora attinorum]KPI37084.1 hypothetical protein AB675_3679 [Phialophora attinorum]
MAAENANIFAGEVFHFDVGYYTFATCLQELAGIRCMMRVQMKESREGRVRLEHVDHDTFLRFAEYLYGQNYNSAEALVVLDQPIDDDMLAEHVSAEPNTTSTTNSAGFDEPVLDEADWGFDS